MPVKIRLRRRGKKKQPFYRIVAVDSRGRRDGKYLDKIGHYNPLTNPAEIVIDEEKAFHWLNQGAQPSDTVNSMFRRQGLLLKWDLMKKGLDEEKITEEMDKWKDLQLEKKKKKEAEEIQKQREAEKGSKETEHVEESMEVDTDQEPEVAESLEASSEE